MAEFEDEDSRTKLSFKFYGKYNFYFLIDCGKENSTKALMASTTVLRFYF